MGKLSVAIEQNNSAVSATRIFVDDSSLSTVLDKDTNSAYIQNMAKHEGEYNVRAITDNGIVEKTIKILDCAKVTILGGDILVEEAKYSQLRKRNTAN